MGAETPGPFAQAVARLKAEDKTPPILWAHNPAQTLPPMTREQFNRAMTNVFNAFERPNDENE